MLGWKLLFHQASRLGDSHCLFHLQNIKFLKRCLYVAIHSNYSNCTHTQIHKFNIVGVIQQNYEIFVIFEFTFAIPPQVGYKSHHQFEYHADIAPVVSRHLL